RRSATLGTMYHSAFALRTATSSRLTSRRTGMSRPSIRPTNSCSRSWEPRIAPPPIPRPSFGRWAPAGAATVIVLSTRITAMRCCMGRSFQGGCWGRTAPGPARCQAREPRAPLCYCGAPGCRTVQVASRAPIWPARSEHELEQKEAAYQQREEEPDQTSEVAIDEPLDPGPEEVDQPGEQEEAEPPADQARHDEDRE